MDSTSGPALPEPVTIRSPGVFASGTPTSAQPLAQTRSLGQGCYLAQWRPRDTSFVRYNGVVRIERRTDDIRASGDLYLHPDVILASSPFRTVPNLDPSPSAGIPVFARKDYRYYLRVTQILEDAASSDTLTLEFERHSFDSDNNTWTNDGIFTAQMTFKTAPVNYPMGATYLKGEIKDSSNTVVGDLTLGWVSKYLRKATLEIDRVALSEYPTDNGSGLVWKTVYDSVDWDVNVYESDTNLIGPSGQSWSNSEMHAMMLNRRDSADLDKEWRYYLLCVPLIDGMQLGIMYDYRSTDSNNVPREGAGIASHLEFPEEPSKWGWMAGKRLAETPDYFRTAVHEIGHAMGLQHYIVDNGFMNQTGLIARSSGKFLENVQWSFSAPDEHRLRHMPDPWVRPGTIPFAKPYALAPLSPLNRLDFSDSVALEVKPLLSTVPIGAPVRVRVTLRNMTDTSVEVPDSLSLKSGHVSGCVVGPGGSSRRFKSVISCVDEHKHQTLEPDGETSHDLTLLRGGDGALFEAPGMHQIKIDVTWNVDNTPFFAHGSAAIMVQPAVTESHAKAAIKTLTTPDLLLTLAIGGDHLVAGIDALQSALADETLNRHYAVIEAKRVARRFRGREADPSKAETLLSNDTVMSPSEAKRLASLVEGVGKHSKSAVEALTKSAVGDKKAEEAVNKLKCTG